ncbi:MAG: transporter substrate-binding domain-containing protein, partial [Chromatiales bacterium]|nr:transporter substrate-binding domain-containing protein [Chromatiales bacterium]
MKLMPNRLLSSKYFHCILAPLRALVSIHLSIISSILLALSSATLYAQTNETTSPSTVEFTIEERAWLAKHPKIVIGSGLEFPPNVIRTKDGDYEGMLFDYIALINQRLGINIELKVGSHGEVVQLLKKGQIDGLSPLQPLKERQHLFNYSNPLYQTYRYIYTRAEDTQKIRRLDNLAGKPVGYLQAELGARVLLQKYGRIKSQPYLDIESMTKALLSGKIDAIVAPFTIGMQQQTQRIIGLQHAAEIPESKFSVVFAFKKGATELTTIINKGLLLITPDEQQAIFNRWMGRNNLYTPLTIPQKIVLTKSEQAFLKAHPTITLGSDGSWTPYVIKNSDGSISGIEVDFIDQINALTGSNIQLVAGNWLDIVKQAERREIDGLAVSAYHKDREQHFLFSDSHYSVYKYIFT